MACENNNKSDISFQHMFENTKSVTKAEKHEILNALVAEYQINPTDAIFNEILVICSHIICVMAARYQNYTSMVDMYQEGLIALHQALQKYDKKRAGVYAYLYMVIQYAMITAICRITAKKNDIKCNLSLERLMEDNKIDWAVTDDFLEVLMLNEEETLEKSKFYYLLSDYEISVIELRKQGYTYPEIAKKLGRNSKSIENCMASCFEKWRRKNGILTKRVYRRKK